MQFSRVFAVITNKLNSGLQQPSTSGMSLLGVLFFILGVPNVYAFLKRRSEVPSRSAPRVVWIFLVAAAIASLVELSAA